MGYALHRKSGNHTLSCFPWNERATAFIQRRVHCVIVLCTDHFPATGISVDGNIQRGGGVASIEHWGDLCGTEHLWDALSRTFPLKSLLAFPILTHFLKGQAGISNYDTFYLPGHIVGSVVIAVVATTVALTLFFILRNNFTNTLYKRASCAVILSGAVTGMHWTAALGTRYRLKPNTGFSRDTRQMTVVITIVMVS